MKNLLRKLRKLFTGPVDIRESWVKGPARAQSEVEFHSWFDRTKSIQETMERAESDWSQRLCRFPGFDDLSKEACLEIGFGGGRLLVPASRTFGQVIGIDIHDAFSRTEEFLRSQGVSNYKLLRREQIEQIPAAGIDFVFSFIVFQHFDTFEEVDFYLAQISRVLQPRGLAHIFFGKSGTQQVQVIGVKDFWKRGCTLFVDPAYFRAHVAQHGFEVLDFEDRMPKRLVEPLATDNESGQARVLLRKRA